MRWLAAAFGAVLALGLSIRAAEASPLEGVREGDLVFQTSRSAQSRAVQLATRSPLSHMGIVYRVGERLMVYEAAGQVKLSPLEAWVARGEGGRVLVKRLRGAEGLLTAEGVSRVKQAGASWLGRPYDAAFGWGDDRLYCSELVWKMLERGLGLRVGEPQRLGDLDLSSPVVARALRERYGERAPLDEPVISPAAMAASPLLETVLER